MERTCEICGSKLTIKELSLDGYDIFRCDHCHHRQLSPLPSKEDIENYYSKQDNTIGNSNAFRNIMDYVGDRKTFHKYHIRRLKEILRYPSLKNRDARFLEIGCGPGCFLALLRDFYGFANVQGIDISKPIVDAGREQLHVDIHCCDAGEVKEYPGAPFDFIYSYHSLEHTSHPSTIVCNMYKNLAEGGELFLSVPNYRGLFGTLAKDKWYWILPPSHIHYFTKDSMKYLLEKAGFRHYSVKTGIISTIGSLPADFVRAGRAIVFNHRVGTLSKSMLETNHHTVLVADLLSRFFLSPLLGYMYLTDTFDTINVYAKKCEHHR